MNKFIATVCYSGCIKYAPGTMGTSVSAILSVILHSFGLGYRVYITITFFSFFIGWLTSSIYSKRTKSDDPKEVVIDELCGYFLSLSLTTIYLPNINAYLLMLLNFILFRFFDILKPFPISFVDKNIKGGFGIMLDDVLAGLMSSFCIIYFGL